MGIKLIASYILYTIGDMLSKLLYYERMSWLYPVYSWLMIKSSNLDSQNKIWKNS